MAVGRMHGKDGVAGSIPAGAPPQTSRPGRVQYLACRLPELRNCRLPESCQLDLYASSWCGPSALGHFEIALAAGPRGQSTDLRQNREVRSPDSRVTRTASLAWGAAA